MEQQQQKAGWYPDPEQSGKVRWWSGQKWEDEWATTVHIPEIRQMREDLHFIRTVVLIWVILTVLGVLFMIGAGMGL